jgi:hypothetical protein
MYAAPGHPEGTGGYRLSNQLVVAPTRFTTGVQAQTSRATLLLRAHPEQSLYALNADPHAAILQVILLSHFPGRAGTVTDTRVSEIARGPVGLTTVLMGAMEIRAGAMLSPCSHAAAHVSGLPLKLSYMCNSAAGIHTSPQKAGPADARQEGDCPKQACLQYQAAPKAGSGPSVRVANREVCSAGKDCDK